jgi:hypothetical protein
MSASTSRSPLRLSGTGPNSVEDVNPNNWDQEQQHLKRTRTAIRRKSKKLLNEIHGQDLPDSWPAKFLQARVKRATYLGQGPTATSYE